MNDDTIIELLMGGNVPAETALYEGVIEVIAKYGGNMTVAQTNGILTQIIIESILPEEEYFA